MRGAPEVHERLNRSDRGERSRTRNGIARNMLRGESWGALLGGDGGVLWLGSVAGGDEAGTGAGDIVRAVWAGDVWVGIPRGA